MPSHEELTKRMLNNPEVKAEYDALAEEFSPFDELLQDRNDIHPYAFETPNRLPL